MSAGTQHRPGISDPVLTVPQVAQILRCSYMTAYRLIIEKRIPAFRLTRRFRILSSDLAAFIANNKDRWSSN